MIVHFILIPFIKSLVTIPVSYTHLSLPKYGVEPLFYVAIHYALKRLFQFFGYPLVYGSFAGYLHLRQSREYVGSLRNTWRAGRT